MILYHLDRNNSINLETGIGFSRINCDLASSKLLSDFKGNVSMHGATYMSASCSTMRIKLSSDLRPVIDIEMLDRNLHTTDERILEYTLELVRRLYFPQFPSRLQSLFALSSVEEFNRWPELRIPQGTMYKLNVPDSTPKFDESWLKGGIMRGYTSSGYVVSYAPTLCFDTAYNYWSQIPSDSPRWEYLVELPISSCELEIAL